MLHLEQSLNLVPSTLHHRSRSFQYKPKYSLRQEIPERTPDLGDPTDIQEFFTDFMDQARDNGDYVGAIISYVKGGQVLFHQGKDFRHHSQRESL